MEITPSYLRDLLEAEIATIHDDRVVTQIRMLLVEPSVKERKWDYGSKGQTYPCWSVMEHPSSDTSIVYCQQGFGPRAPWGLVARIEGSDDSMGMDSGWFSSFLEAYFGSFAPTNLPIWRVFREGIEADYGTAITEESDWDSTWEMIYKLRKTDGKYSYNCHHSIQLGTSSKSPSD